MSNYPPVSFTVSFKTQRSINFSVLNLCVILFWPCPLSKLRSANVTRVLVQVQVHALSDEHHRRGGHHALLHRPGHHGQRRRVRRVRHAASLPRVPHLQVLEA